jgi:hypothetical protein
MGAEDVVRDGIYVGMKMRERLIDKIMWCKGGHEVGRRGAEAKSKDEDRGR